MKKVFSLPAFIFLFSFVHGQQVTIIESQSGNPGHVMDNVWQNLAQSLGYTAGIYPQTTLDNNAFFPVTDILVVSSGINALPPNRVNIIEQFILQGGNVYLQSEYLMSFSSNQAFQTIVNNLGGGFSWTADISGDLNPMNILGSLALNPFPVSPLGYYWYGCAGSGCSNVDPFLEYQGQYFGFVFCPGTAGVGKLITTSDQDWIRTATPNDSSLGKNILFMLADTINQCTAITYPLLNLGPDTTICMGDSIILNAGSGFTSYLWQNGVTDSTLTVSAPGSYIVTVNTPCNTYTDTVTVNSVSCSNAPVVMLSSSDTTFCDKKCLDFTDLSTNSPTSWQWLFPGAVPASDTAQNPVNVCYNAYGSFDVTLIACNASGCDTLFLPSFITEYQIPAQPLITQSNDTLYCSPSYNSYAWYNSLNPGVVISTFPFLTTSNGGSYFVIVGDSLGCQNSSPVFTATGIAGPTEENIFIEVTPVAAGSALLISWNGNENAASEISLFNPEGRQLYSAVSRTSTTLLHTGLFPSGIYFLRIILQDGFGVRKIIISH